MKVLFIRSGENGERPPLVLDERSKAIPILLASFINVFAQATEWIPNFELRLARFSSANRLDAGIIMDTARRSGRYQKFTDFAANAALVFEVALILDSSEKYNKMFRLNVAKSRQVGA